jgi:hypothetical protein
MGGWGMGSIDQFPLSVMGFTGVEAADDSISGTDISLAELGLSLEDLVGSEENVRVVGFSANHGQQDEALLATVATAGTRIFAVVAATNESYSLQPYSMQVETSSLPDIAQWLSQHGMTYTSPVTDWSGDDTEVLHTYSGGSPQTLFVTQKERIIGRYGQQDDQPDWDELLASITDLAERADIAGDIISVPISIYQSWDGDYSSIDAANEVTLEIRNIIADYLSQKSGIQYIVIIGNDDIIPYHRVPDETSIGNEHQYTMSSLLKPGSPLFYSVANSNILTDDYYVDEMPTPWQGRSLYIPDLAVARLVEKPSEIIETAEAFVASDGVLSPGTALVTGYDFFGDGAQAVSDILTDAGIDVHALITLWNAEELQNEFLDNTYDINNINAHYTHYAALSAAGFYSNDLTDILTSTQVSNANLPDGLDYTMGCHAGLNVPDEAAPSAEELGSMLDPQKDFPQALHRAIYLASTGYGYGDDEGIGGTERLMGIFTEELLQDGSPTVGEALVAAKQHYLNSTSAGTVYDEKSSIQFTLYGLPQYAVQTPGGVTNQSLLTQAITSSSDTINISPDLQMVTTEQGDYYTADGDSQATAFRPVQPRVVVELPNIPDESSEPVHGVLFLDGDFTDYPDFNPVLTRPTNEWELAASEFQITPPTFWPSELAVVNNFLTGDQLKQTLVVTPGQFRSTGVNENDEVIGIERLYTSLTLELLRSDSDDYTPPAVSNIGLNKVGDGIIAVSGTARDDSGVARIVVLSIGGGTMTSTSKSLEGPPTSGTFTINVPFTSGDTRLVIMVIDEPGNIYATTGRGTNVSVIEVSADTALTVDENSPVTMEATVSDFGSLTPPVFYIWQFGDGTSTTGITTDGTIEVQHTYLDDDPTGTPSGDYTATLKVTDANGGIGTATTTVTVNDVAPVVTIESVTSPIDENDETTLTASFTDVGTLDTHTATIDWGDGSTSEPDVSEENGSGTFTATHQYLDDDPTGTPEDDYDVTVTVTDDDTLTGQATPVVTADNLAPTVEAGDDQTVDEGDEVSLDPATFTDVGTLDTHTATIDWGDGTTPDEADIVDSTVPGSHVYADNGINEVTVTVTDDDTGAGSDSLTVTVNNVPPEVGDISVSADTVPVNNEIDTSADFTDPGVLDTHTAVWDWGDGSTSEGDVSEADGSGSVTGSHAYTTPGLYTVTLTVTDKDGGEGQSVFQYVEVALPVYQMQNFVIRYMNINWREDSGHLGMEDIFNIAGRLRLPEGFTVADLERSATITLAIADESGNDIIQLRSGSLGRLGTLWSYLGDEQPPGEGINIKAMAVWWAPAGGKWTGWAGFYLRGVLELSEEIGIDTVPAQATVTIEIPVAEGGSVIGEQTIEFQVNEVLHQWTYNVWPALPSFPYDRDN